MRAPAQDNHSSPQKYFQPTARILSDLLSPPMVFAALGFVVAWFELPFWAGLLRGAIYGVLISLLPLIFVVYLLKTGRVGDLHLRDRQHRRIPYLISFSGSVAAFLLFRRLEGGELLLSLAIGNMLGFMAVAFVAFLYGVFSLVTLSPLILMVFYARWYLRRHTLAQLMAGLLVGGGTVALLAWFGLI